MNTLYPAATGHAFQAPSDAPRPTVCVYPGCVNTSRTRGQCHQHYQTARAYIRDGKATEADLLDRGLLLPKGTGGAKVSGHSAFLLGSDVRGTA